MPKNLTDLGIERKGAPKRRTFTADARCPGLFLVEQPTGKKSWVVARRLEGRFTKMKIGGFPAFGVESARREASKYLQAFDRGESPKDVKRVEQADRQAIRSETVSVVAENWLKRDQGDKRSLHEVENFVEKNLLPAWGDRPISSISKKDCLAFVDTFVDAGHTIRGRRVFSYIHRMLAWCVERDILPLNPMAGAKKPGSENDRERVLTDRELVEVWQASELLDGDPRRGEPLKTNQYRQDGKIWEPIIKLLILCGARREEIGGLKWSEVNLGGAVLTLTGERTKRQPKDKNKPRLIFLSQKAVEIIGSIPRREGCDYVFSTTGKSPVSGWEKAKTRLERLIAKARIEKGIEEEMPEWRIHDLRRVFAVGFQKLGVRLEVTEQALAHLSGSRSGVTKTYQRYNYEKECREGVELWADHVDEILSGKFEEKIISMKRERAKVS